MQSKKFKENYFFVDEAGDPFFYDRYGRFIVGKEGCSKILLLGFIMTQHPETLRKAVLSLKEEIKKDNYLKNIPSIKKTAISFHAKDDCSEVREKFFKMIADMDFTSEFIVARKLEDVFHTQHKKMENVFYDDLIIQLFKNKLHLSENNYIYFATRGNKTRQAPLEAAVQTAILAFEKTWNKKVDSKIKVFPQSPAGEPCLQIIDYMNWAVQRAFIKKDDRYLKFVEQKIRFICDIYDFNKYPNNFYSRKNEFELNKISPL